MSAAKKSPKASPAVFQAPKGMHDLLPPETYLFDKFIGIAKKIAEFYRFEFIETPVLENAELFSRGVGLSTDIVEKEMYVFRTKGGDKLALRPEGTAGAVRAFIQNGMAQWPMPVKLYYWGPFFRHESPQAGRFRQFRQLGLEYFGEEHQAVDAEIIQVTLEILRAFGIKNYHVEINSIGCPKCRPAYKALLKNYYRRRVGRLCADCKRRLKENPLRLLDCKNEICVLMKGGAPETVENLCEACRSHFKGLLDFLDDLAIPYLLNPYLVRGLDYYNRTVFEVIPDEGKEVVGPNIGGSSLASVGGGGRFDYLVEALGGPKMPAVGVALGIERLILAYKEQGGKMPAAPAPKIFLVQLGELAKKKSLRLMEDFRKADLLVATSLGRDSIKAQLKAADRLAVAFALILGQKEALEESVIIRDMQTGVQETVPLDKLIPELRRRLKSS